MRISDKLAGLLGIAVIATASAAGQEAAAPPAMAGDADAGAELYANDCKGCHSVSIGPTLRGVLGRPIASVASFGGYSEGLKARGAMTWTEANLDAFLIAPQTFAPGTLMVKAIPDAQARADVIAYIASMPPPRP